MEVNSSLAATMALLLWIPACLLVFSMMRPHRAAAVLLVYGALFLPELEFFSIKLLPNMDKKTITCAWVFFPAMLWCQKSLRRVRLGKVPWFLFSTMVVVDIGRALLNQDQLVYGGRVIPPVYPHTALTFIMEDFLLVFVPYYLGAALYDDREKLRDLMRTFAVAGLAYLPFVLIELRLSPQLHNWIYGYHQHTFMQVMRAGGYRPMVFMEHGLAVALFMTTAALCMFGLARAKDKLMGIGMLPFAALLSAVVAVSHSMGALVFLCALGPLVWFLSAKTQLRAAVLMALLVMLYPMLRAYDWIPTKDIVDFVMGISPDRAWSLQFRFENEDIVLRRAFERPLFGWGGFDRMFIFDEESGDEVSTLDGAWLIVYAQSGALGFVSKFGLLTWPVLRALKRVRKVGDRRDRLVLSSLGVCCAMVAVDLLPNGLFTYFPFLLSGALLGASRKLAQRTPLQPPVPQAHVAPPMVTENLRASRLAHPELAAR